MNKQEFLAQLRKRLTGLPQSEITERLAFYSEMIDDRMDEGLSEEDAVLAAGSVDDITSQVITDTPLSKIAKERINTKRQFHTWELLLLILGAPIWLPILISAISVIFSLYISLWSVIISLWAVFVSAVACCAAGVVAGIVITCVGKFHAGIALISGGVVCAGLAILLCLACKVATKGTLLLAQKCILWIKGCFMRKEEI